MSKLASFGGDCQHYGKPNDYLVVKIVWKMKEDFEDWLETPTKTHRFNALDDGNG
jgi:hypothetical protein